MTTSLKFADPYLTAKGDKRAYVPFEGLETLWVNTGSLCNIACANCYMESSPKNDDLVYLTADEVLRYVDEARQSQNAFKQVGLTGGKPFMNPDIIKMISGVLEKKLNLLVLTNAMKPFEKHKSAVAELSERYGENFVIRVSLDHHSRDVHDAERGHGGFDTTIQNMIWMSQVGLTLNVAGRSLTSETLTEARQNYDKLFETKNIVLKGEGPVVLFPEMKEEDKSPPEITTSCWDILNKKPESVMCANSRMLIKKKGDSQPSVCRCTLLPYDPYFNSGSELSESFKETHLKHVYCAQFCVLGGASCSA